MKEIMDRGPVQGTVNLKDDNIIEIIRLCNDLVSKYQKTQIICHSEETGHMHCSSSKDIWWVSSGPEGSMTASEPVKSKMTLSWIR